MSSIEFPLSPRLTASSRWPLLSSVVRFRPVAPCNTANPGSLVAAGAVTVDTDGRTASAALDRQVVAPVRDCQRRCIYQQIDCGAARGDPVARLDRVDSALHAMIRANEASLRLILMNSLQRAGNGDVPPRQNRRTPLIESCARAGARPIQTCGIEESRPGPGTYHRHRGDDGVQGRTAAGRG